MVNYKELLVRPQIQELLDMGSLPSEDTAVKEQLDAYVALLNSINTPVTDEEALRLASLFGDDGCYGVAWTLLHLVETAPNWPPSEPLQNEDNEWIRRIYQRAENTARLRDEHPCEL